MAWKLVDFECDCGWAGEELINYPESFYCPECCVMLEPLTTFPHIGAFSAASTEQKQEVLRKRSEEDTKKQVAKEPERWGQTGKQRAMEERNPQVGYTGTKK